MACQEGLNAAEILPDMPSLWFPLNMMHTLHKMTLNITLLLVLAGCAGNVPDAPQPDAEAQETPLAEEQSAAQQRRPPGESPQLVIETGGHQN
jgi:hypothetical protein